MPTENRSSNTEMVSALMPCPFCGEKPQITKHHREDIYSFMHRCPVLGPISLGFREDQQAHIEKWNARAQPAPQPHPEPIAWMVGTAFWWTKEEAERDAAATGLPIVGLGPMTDTAEVERLESRIKTQRESIRSHVQEVDRLRVLEIKYGLKIEERNDLLRKCLEWITSARDGVLYPIARDFEGVVGRNAEGLGQETPALIDAIDDALSDSAAPSAPVELDERAAFEKGYHKDALHRDGDEYSRMAVQMAWEGWQARAALERKPS
ncbi:hypothetical protein PPUJ13061_56330 [Pseudomonas putida]|uniref:Lar family restriction alleviation protein n=1 Tax=Pseudomonas putida TaxID=303 RepID=UPI000E0DA39C|nr:Lar family restriction alleviation protein [Pseudomonas putida]WQE51910.1 hypothetical protein U0028_18715 [Pseudomonas putida]GLO05729.1 hypothetical protein PPUJ13061_56330 [Pseudomonas putida]HDS1009525.1 Lar family restriction alleviation protein [Pseudomonas putida]